MNVTHRCSAVLLLLPLLMSASLQAANKLEFTGTDPLGKPAPAPTIYLEGNKARFEQAQSMVMLFDATTPDTITLLNSQQKQYLVMSPAIMEQQQKAIQARLDQEKAKLTAEQRQQLEQAMQRQPGQVGELRQQKPTVFQLAGSQKQVNGIPCQAATATRDGKVVRELCIATGTDLKLPPQEYATLQALLKLFQTLSNATRSPGASDLSPLATGDIPGIPVEAKHLGSQNRTATMSLTSSTQAPVDAQWFILPSDYAPAKIPEAY